MKVSRQPFAATRPGSSDASAVQRDGKTVLDVQPGTSSQDSGRQGLAEATKSRALKSLKMFVVEGERFGVKRATSA